MGCGLSAAEVASDLVQVSPSRSLILGAFEYPDLRHGTRRVSPEPVFQTSSTRCPSPTALEREASMDVVHARCAGLDVHKESVVACMRVVAAGKVTRETRTFGTTTAALLALSDRKSTRLNSSH